MKKKIQGSVNEQWISWSLSQVSTYINMHCFDCIGNVNSLL